MNIKESLRIDDQIFKALNLLTINRIICQTDKGMLSLQIRKGDNKYFLMLDSVPLEKEKNQELMDILFPIQNIEIPQVVKNLTPTRIPFEGVDLLPTSTIVTQPKKKGRPAKKK